MWDKQEVHMCVFGLKLIETEPRKWRSVNNLQARRFRLVRNSREVNELHDKWKHEVVLPPLGDRKCHFGAKVIALLSPSRSVNTFILNDLG
jgi:hypothetical protein